MTSVSGEYVNISEAADEDWKNQDILIGGTIPYKIVAVNTIGPPGVLRISPAYAGATIDSGTVATIRQVRVPLPAGFGSMLDYVQRDAQRSWVSTPAIMTEALHGNCGFSMMHSVHGNDLLIWPTGTERLYFRYMYRPENLFEYSTGAALVKTADLTSVIGQGVNWSVLPNEAMVFEEAENVVRGMPQSHAINTVLTATNVRLGSEWNGTTGTAFSYVISSDVSLPDHMDLWVYAKAQFRSGKRDEAFVERQYLRSKAADVPSDEISGSASGTEWALSSLSPVR
jgi:hypothetical protein